MEGRVWEISGAVQGVGFRPWVYRVARGLGLRGCVRNTPTGVRVEAIGSEAALARMGEELRNGGTPAGRVRRLRERAMEPAEVWFFTNESKKDGFWIGESEGAGGGVEDMPQIAPDLAMCRECLAEIRDRGSRRWKYPFTTCAYCGPRYTIFEGLPFDRERTVMREFPLCAECEAEYRDAWDRRFHAQAIACPRCGPWLRLLDARGRELTVREEALEVAGRVLREGAIVAVLGVGGFHLMVRADGREGVLRLRRRKRREWKPFAMVCREVGELGGAVRVSKEEMALLRSPAAPIVLLERTGRGPEFSGVADGVSCLGVMLASNPLQWLLLEEVGVPLVATSGNVSEMPICYEVEEGLARLGDVADFFLVHNRRVVRRCDDSVVRVVAGEGRLVRRGRGYVPLPLELSGLRGLADGVEYIGVGGHQKNCVCLLSRGELLLGAHLGDLGTERAREEWRRDVEWLKGYSREARKVYVCDWNKDYGSTIELERMAVEVEAVQHHAAHGFAALAEAGWEEALAVVWDGTGLGVDGEIWGGEFLEVDWRGQWRRVGHLGRFVLPGGERAAREPVRSAAGVLASLVKGGVVELGEIRWLWGLRAEWRRLETFLRLAGDEGEGCVRTTSAGRLFDAVAWMVGLVEGEVSEAQAAMVLEGSAWGYLRRVGSEPSAIRQLLVREVEEIGVAVRMREEGENLIVEWEEVVAGVIREMLGAKGDRKAELERAAWRWHVGIARAVEAVVRRVGSGRVILTGGCFQNRLLGEMVVELLGAMGVEIFLPRELPCNDGGLSAGQAIGAAMRRGRQGGKNFSGDKMEQGN